MKKNWRSINGTGSSSESKRGIIAMGMVIISQNSMGMKEIIELVLERFSTVTSSQGISNSIVRYNQNIIRLVDFKWQLLGHILNGAFRYFFC